MTEDPLRTRRATLDDLDALKSLWASMRLPVDEMEKRLTEFQIAEDATGRFAGALGLQIVRQHALLHSEEYPNFADADAARELFWERIQKLAATHGIFRLWTQERSRYWSRLGFLPADAETLARLPDEWKKFGDQLGASERSGGGWFTLELKNEAAINAALENKLAGFMADEKKSVEEVSARVKQVTTFITIACFGIFFICLALAFWLFLHRR